MIRGRKDGWYAFYGKAGAFGDWSKEIKQTWSINTQGLSSQQKTELHQQIQRAKKALEEETRRGQEETSKEALKIWQALSRIRAIKLSRAQKHFPYWRTL